MNHDRLAELLYPHIAETPEELEKRYPPRNLPEGACVARFSPSPTGFVHMGAMYGVMMDERIAHRLGGVFYLRIEDTDAKREIDDGVGIICRTLESLGIHFDEGATSDGDKGLYGPYRQRQRLQIYQCFAKKMVRLGRAYPCFCSEDELAAMRAKQEEQKANFGYYGPWAKCRDLSFEEIERHIQAKDPFVLRFRSEGDPNRRVVHNDLIHGRLEFPENDMDHVMLKSDGVPTYHFAHVVDDHLMRTTHVIRGEEWLPSLPLHLEMFSAIGWDKPEYGHTALVMKMDGGSKRKLSKRKDPEADMRYYMEKGYYIPAIMDYIMTLVNSNFEEWRLKNPDAPYQDFPFSPAKAGVSGALFDLAKLNDVCKNRISRLDAETVYGEVVRWAAEYDAQLHTLLTRDPDYAKAIFAIGRGGPKPRKDIAVWSEVKEYISFFYDELFSPVYEFPQNLTPADCAQILDRYAGVYQPDDDQNEWFSRIRKLTEDMGCACDMKEYKKNPGGYRGHVGDVSMVLRVAVTGRTNSPDLYQVMSLLGAPRISQRLSTARCAISM